MKIEIIHQYVYVKMATMKNNKYAKLVIINVELVNKKNIAFLAIIKELKHLNVHVQKDILTEKILQNVSNVPLDVKHVLQKINVLFVEICEIKLQNVNA